MERTLNDINYLITKLKARVDNAQQESHIAAIEVDIMLDLLRQTYLAVEELKTDSLSAQVHPFEKAHIPPSILDSEQPLSEIRDKVPFEKVPQNNCHQPDQQPESEITTQPVVQPELEIMLHPVIQSEPEISAQPVIHPEPAGIAQPEHTVNGQPASLPEPETVMQETPLATSSTRQSPHTADLFGAPSIADMLKSDVPSLNDKMTSGKGDQSLAHRMQLKPITDLKTAIGINEKFQFLNDLFDGHTENYNDAITRLNNCDSGSQALWLLDDLKNNHNWDEQDETFNNLKVLINRRYL